MTSEFMNKMNTENFFGTETLTMQQMQKGNPRSRSGFLANKLGIVLCTALLGYAARGQPSVSIAVSAPTVEIRAESDFYEPLAPEGEWVVVGSYGRCWRPSHVESDWRPYCNGSWERTDAGWYWVSDEPWAWATYHYGRWDYADQYGWYWVPQIQWAPAWVSWHEGGGYIGWAPLQPSVSISVNGYVGFSESRISPRAFVFVKQGQFQDRIRPSIVVVNNTTIINRTKTITNTKIVNKTVINEGPATSVIAKASGRPVRTVALQELRHKEEAPVVTRQRTAKGTEEIKQAPVHSGLVPENKAPVAPHETASARKTEAVTSEPTARTVKPNEAPAEKHDSAPATPELKPEVKHAPAIKEPSEQNPNRPARPEKPVQQENKAQQPAREKPVANENNGAHGNQDHQNKSQP
jgi:hypothetical protein